MNEDLPSLDPSTLSLPNKALPVFTLTITPSLPCTNTLNSFAYHRICWKIVLPDAFHCSTLSEVPHHDVYWRKPITEHKPCHLWVLAFILENPFFNAPLPAW